MNNRIITGTFFEVKVAYEKTLEDGCYKTVNEQYVVDALTFTEAECNIITEMTPFITGDFKVVGISRAKYSEICFTDDVQHDKFFKAKVAVVTLDEKADKEKESAIIYLTQADSMEQAQKNIVHMFESTAISYKIKSITETKIIDIFEHDKSTD